jgi:hypothetical protein
MEHLIKSFTRVIRKVDEAEKLIAAYPELEKSALSDPSSLSNLDRRRLLDFPEPEIQSSNISSSSQLEKLALLKRAVETPQELTSPEILLLQERYWRNIASPERRARTNAAVALQAVSLEHWTDVTDQLKRVREPLYEENEEKAMENAIAEALRRMTEGRRVVQEQETLRVIAKARPWVRRLWEEDRAQKDWGYGVFVDPAVLEDSASFEEYSVRRDAALFWARGAICCGDMIGARWKMQVLEWPENAKESDEMDVKSQRLREHFKSLRDRAPKRQRTGDMTKSNALGLSDGLLRNVVLFIDKACNESVLATGHVDDMWLWALDLDYDADPNTSQTAEYGGYLRVRVQQLFNNFFELRRYQSEEYQMLKIWEMAQMSKNDAFVSVKEDEASLHSLSRDVGSAIRPPKPQ